MAVKTARVVETFDAPETVGRDLIDLMAGQDTISYFVNSPGEEFNEIDRWLVSCGIQHGEHIILERGKWTPQWPL